MKYIFDEIIETKDIYMIIDESAKNEEDKAHMVMVVKDIIHHKVVDAVLGELDEEKSVIFIQNLDDETQHESLLKKLGEWVVDFEKKVAKVAVDAEKEIVRLLKS